MNSWKYPLHFIDFETTMAAIPFNRGKHPYEGIAFQYSHHVVHKNGTVEHAGQYLNAERGVFPSYDFLRNLKNELTKDNGSVFRYSNHENTYLNMIYNQLKSDTSKISDKKELLEFIKSITHSTKNSTEDWTGDRDMIDLWVFVKRHYYDPATNGSNSIKFVLPAILNSSEFLQKKYSKPIYGAVNGIKSHNFKDWKWIEHDEKGRVKDPYKLLPDIFSDISKKDMENLLMEDESIREGGAAMTAYAKMQFEEMSEYERTEIRKALLKYCELDTMAMVMIYEGWKDLISTP